MPGMMNSAPSTSQGFGSPTLVTFDHRHVQQANQTPLRRRVGEHGKINRNEYDHSKTVKTSKHIISSACLQSVDSILPTYVQVTEDSDTVCQYEQLYSDSCHGVDLSCPSESCDFAKNVKGSLDSCSLTHDQVGSSDNPSLYTELRVSNDNYSFREDQLYSKNTGSLTENCEASGYVCSHFEDFKETKPFCSLTEELKVSKESLLTKLEEELHGPTDYDSFIEDHEEFGDFCPLFDKKEKSRDIHYHNPAPEQWQESECLYSLCENKKKYTKISFWIIQIFTNLFFFKWGMQRSNHVQEEVARRSKSLHKSNHDEKDVSKSTYRPMPPPSVGRKDNIPFKSSGVHVRVHNTLTLTSPMSRAITKTRIVITILLLIILQTAGEDVPLDCKSKVHLTSPNYPSNYPNDAYMKWHATAPLGRRILVEFNDFKLEETFDFLDLLDIVDIRNKLRFTGERFWIPSFLTKGNALDATFASFGTDTERGFSITVSCYKKSNTSGGRLEGGNTPAEGSLELLSPSGEWVGVCEDILSATLTEIICGELGYPGVKEISYKTGGCQSNVNDQTCVRAPSCEDNTYLLKDCSFAAGNCTTSSSVEIRCYEPGFKGCYGFDIDELQNGSTHNSASKCILSCRGKASHDIAVFDGDKCFCSTASEVDLLNRKPAQNLTTCPGPAENNQQIVSALVYDVSVGFCNQTDDVINGTWDSNITWFGSIVHLTCDEGYILNGSEALQCVPEVSSYYPVWNHSMPTCDRFEVTTMTTEWFSSTSNIQGCTLCKSDTPGPEQLPEEDPPRRIPTSYIILICIIALILVIFIILVVIKRKVIRYKVSDCTFMHREDHRTSTEDNGRRTYRRRGHIGNQGGGTGPNFIAEHSPVTTTHFYHDGELQADIFRTRNRQIRISEPSGEDITPFPSFNHTSEHTENHYHIEDESHSYYSLMDSGVSNQDHTDQNRLRHIGTSQNTYELGNFRDTRECRTEMKSMSDRPLPHRPISCSVQEGPSLPPRGQTTSSSCGSPETKELNTHPSDYNMGASATDKEGSSAIFCSHLGNHGNLFSNDKVEILREGETSKQLVVDVNPCPGTTSRATTQHEYYSVGEKEDENIIPVHSTRPEPFYHCLEDDQQMYSDKDELMECEDRDDNPSGMIDNILYNPLNI